MISNQDAARTMFEAAFGAYNQVYQALEAISDDLPPEELSAVKNAVGRVMGEILAGVTEPILEKHPELMPPEWRDADQW